METVGRFREQPAGPRMGRLRQSGSVWFYVRRGFDESLPERQRHAALTGPHEIRLPATRSTDQGQGGVPDLMPAAFNPITNLLALVVGGT